MAVNLYAGHNLLGMSDGSDVGCTANARITTKVSAKVTGYAEYDMKSH